MHYDDLRDGVSGDSEGCVDRRESDRLDRDTDGRETIMACGSLLSCSGGGEPADVRSISVAVGRRVFVADCRTAFGSSSSPFMLVTIGWLCG